MDPKSELLKIAEQVEQRLLQFVERVMLKLQADTVQILYDNNIVGHTKQLSQNIRYEVIKKAGEITGIFGVGENVKSKSGSPWNYGLIRHFGRRPSAKMPPVDEIQKWVIYKGIVRDSAGKMSTLRKLKARSKMKRNSDPAYAASRSIAFAIAKKIQKRGYEGFRFLEIALEQNISFIAGEVANMKLI
jgi:hypothetical protein